MVCTPRYICGEWSEAAYNHRASKEGKTFRERNRSRLSCTVCGVAVTGGGDRGGGVPVTYVVSFPWVLKTVRYSVTGCQAVAHSAVRLREHFMYRNFFSWIAVVQERREMLPRCDLCGIHIPEGG